MKDIEILDCTLRDGGYVNDNQFGERNIKKIIEYLHDAKIDYIECGYLMDDIEYDKDKTEFETANRANRFLVPGNNYTLMLLGEKYKIENLPEAPKIGLNTIRMSFHRHSIPKAIEFAKEITKKGYKLFLQPTAIMTYEDDEIIEMIKEFNKLDIEAVAIVDTFGQMRPADTKKYTELFDQYLDDSIKLGIHLHNNLQTAFTNAIIFLDTVKESRKVVIDTSLLGIGRGAGNLPTELLASHLNDNYGKNYNLAPLLEAEDTIISKIKQEHEWGYSLPYFLSSIYSCHPSYVLFLINKKMLNSTDISNVLSMISVEKKSEYDKTYIEELYESYNDKNYDDTKSFEKLRKLIQGKELLLIGPGQSIVLYEQDIKDYIASHDCFVINVNNSSIFEHDAVFYSNKKRYDADEQKDNDIKIITSNISTEEKNDTIIFDYSKSISRKKDVSASALLVFLNILEQAGINHITLAGFDGFSEKNNENFSDSSIAYLLDKNYIKELNRIMKDNIESYQKNIKIKTLTKSKNIEN